MEGFPILGFYCIFLRQFFWKIFLGGPCFIIPPNPHPHPICVRLHMVRIWHRCGKSVWDSLWCCCDNIWVGGPWSSKQISKGVWGVYTFFWKFEMEIFTRVGVFYIPLTPIHPSPSPLCASMEHSENYFAKHR